MYGLAITRHSIRRLRTAVRELREKQGDQTQAEFDLAHGIEELRELREFVWNLHKSAKELVEIPM